MTNAKEELLDVLTVTSEYLNGIVAIALCESQGHVRRAGENACSYCIPLAAKVMKSTIDTRTRWVFAALVDKYGEPTIEERNYVIVGRDNPVKEPTQRRLVCPWQGVRKHDPMPVCGAVHQLIGNGRPCELEYGHEGQHEVDGLWWI